MGTNASHISRQGLAKYLEHHHTQLMKQDKSYTCGPATVQNVLLLLHQHIPAEDRLAKTLGCDETSGTDPAKIESYFRRNGIYFTRFNPETDDMDGLLASGHIILIEFQDYVDSYGEEEVHLCEASHFAVVVGCDDHFVYLVDPYHPVAAHTQNPLVRIQRAQFEKNWRSMAYDGSKIVENYGLVFKAPLDKYRSISQT